MTSLAAEKGLSPRTEQIALGLRHTTVLAAKYAALHEGVSLDAWVDRVVLDRALEQQARLSAEEERARPGEFAEWHDHVAKHLFGREDAQ